MPKEPRETLEEEAEPAAAEHRAAQEDIAHQQWQATQRQHAEVPARIVHVTQPADAATSRVAAAEQVATTPAPQPTPPAQQAER